MNDDKPTHQERLKRLLNSEGKATNPPKNEADADEAEVSGKGAFGYLRGIRDLPGSVIDQAAPWISFYKAHTADFTQLVYPLLDDPLNRDWTALQSWDPDAGRGALLAFRQESSAPSKTIALENVPDGRRFNLYSAPDGALVQTVTSADLQHGVTIDLPQQDTAKVLLIEPAS